MKKLFDLRFVIGAFFVVVGLVLLFYGLFASGQEEVPVNKWCGGIFILFGTFMLILSIKKPIE